MKDNFSTQSAAYALYRPGYPERLFDWIYQAVPGFEKAWDCATGNGQVATKLALTFKKVQATDISPAQISNAVSRPNIHYSVQPAEYTSFSEKEFDLVTVAQAIHWFDFDDFYHEVRRVTKPDGILAVIGYGLPDLPEGPDKILKEFYHNMVGPYWDKERHYLDNLYQSIPFPFAELCNEIMPSVLFWDLETLCGFLESWSATAHFINRKGYSPVVEVRRQFVNRWPETEMIPVTFPVILRLAVIK